MINKKVFNGKRVLLARSIRNVSSPQLAKEIGISKQAIGQYENGQTVPALETIHKLASALDVLPGFFYEGTGTSYSPGEAYCRATTTTTRSTKTKQTNIDVLKVIVYRYFSTFISYPEKEMLVQCAKAVTNLSPSEAAMRIRVMCNLGDRPIKNMVNVLQNMGIFVTTYYEENGHMDAISHMPILIDNEGKEKKYFVTTYNLAKTTAARLNFTLAHELGHWILGHIISDEDTQQDEEYHQNEDEANEFASSFLIPEKTFLEQLYNPTSLQHYIQLKPTWHVSAAMMIKRAYNLQQISTSQYQYLFRQMSMRGWRTAEPGDMVEIPKPTLMSNSVRMLDTNQIISKQMLLASLNENCFTATQQFYESILDVPEHTLDPIHKQQSIKLDFPSVSET